MGSLTLLLSPRVLFPIKSLLCQHICFLGAMWHHPRWTGHGGVSDRIWSTGEGNGKPLQYSCLENSMNSMKRQKDRTLKDELPRSIGAQYATGDQWRNNSRKNEEMEPKQKQYPAVDVTGDGTKSNAVKSNTA